MKKIFWMIIITLTFLSLTGCQSAEEPVEEVIEEEETEKDYFTITDNNPSSVYSYLSDISYETKDGETGLLAVPSGFYYQDHMFDNSFESESKMTYKFYVEEKDFNEYLDFMESFYEDDLSVTSIEKTRMLEYGQIKAEFNTGLTEFVFAMETHDLMISFVIDYKMEEITSYELNILTDLKDAYLLDLMELPDEIIVEPEEIDEEANEEYYNEFEEKYDEFLPEGDESSADDVTAGPSIEEFEATKSEETYEEGEQQ